MSGQYGEPDWANPTASSSAPASSSEPAASGGDGGWTTAATGEDFSSAVNTNPNTGGRNASGGKPNCIQSLLSIFSIGLSAMMCCLGAFGIMEANELAEIFVSVYMILFSVLLFLYELLWWSGRLPCCDGAKVNRNLRTNFGFMYGVKGRAAYLIFVAFLVIGLKNDVSVQFLRYLTGGCFAGTGVMMLFLHFSKPELLGTYKAPTTGLGEDDVNMPV